MPSNLHPQAMFDPIPPDLDLSTLVEKTPNFDYVIRISTDQIRELGLQEFEKLVLLHVIQGGKPLVVEGWESDLPPWLYSSTWMQDNLGKKQEQVRDITNHTNIPMTTGHYLNSLEKLTRQWTPTNFRDLKRQRLYLKDIDCPQAWDHQLREYIPQTLLYLNNCVGEKGGPGSVHERDKYNHLVMGQGIAPAGDLMSNLPPDMRAENMMCYIGHEGTYTPAHREMCATVGQNIMVETSDVGKGETPGSSIWFMTETKDREVVSEYFLSMLGHDIEVENHFAQIVAWKKAPFPVYIVEQKVGDFILIPPLAPHQVWNRGTRTVKVAWNRTTVETLEMALSEALPRARMVCRDEQYKCKAIVFYSLLRYYTGLQKAEKEEESGFGAYQSEPVRFAPRVRQLQRDFKRLFGLYKTILVSEMFSPDMPKENNVEFIQFDSNVTCSYCRCNIFNRFLTCKTCVGELENGDEDTYDICMDCYAMGRSCACLSNLQWVEQWRWPELTKRYDVWRAMVLYIDGYVDNTSPQTLEIERKYSGKKPIAQICQEQLKKRPWRDITKPHVLDPLPGDSDVEPEADDEGRPKKRKGKRQSLAGKKRQSTCHICKKLEADWKLAFCTTCPLSYCYGTLWRAFDIKPEKIMETLDWQCPKCQLICSCGACRRLNSSKQIPYQPKGTLLGHDTRMVADPRSVESLVDFSRTNLAWLKGEEDTAPKDSVRMKKLMEKAQAEKSRDETLEEDSEMGRRMDSQHMDIQPVGDAIDPALLSAGDGGAPTAPMFGGTDVSNLPPTIDVDANPAFVSPADLMKNPDYSVYPGPQGIPRERMMGIGYYQQRNDADKILFDAPDATADDEHQDAAYPRLQSDTEDGLLVQPNKKRPRESLKGRVDEAHLQFQAAQKKQKLTDAKREGKFFMTKNKLEGGKPCKVKLLLPNHKEFLGRLEAFDEEEEAPRHNPRPGRRSLARKEQVAVDSTVVTSNVREDVVYLEDDEEEEELEINTIVAVRRNPHVSISAPPEKEDTIVVELRKPKGRPPKSQVSGPAVLSPTLSNSPEAQRRGRGRLPRRSDVTEPAFEPVLNNSPETQRRGPGRPPKSQIPEPPLPEPHLISGPENQRLRPGRPRRSDIAVTADRTPENGITSTAAAAVGTRIRRSGMLQKPAVPAAPAAAATVEPASSSQKKPPGRPPSKSTSLGVDEGVQANKHPRSPEAQNMEADTRPEKKRRGSILFVSDDSDEVEEVEITNSFTAVNSVPIKKKTGAENTPKETTRDEPIAIFPPRPNSTPKDAAHSPGARPRSRYMDGSTSLSPRPAQGMSTDSPIRFDGGDNGGVVYNDNDNDDGGFFSSHSSHYHSATPDVAEEQERRPPASGKASSASSVISSSYRDAKMEAMRLAEEGMEEEMERARVKRGGVPKPAAVGGGSASFKAQFFAEESVSPPPPPPPVKAAPVTVPMTKLGETPAGQQPGKSVTPASRGGRGGMQIRLPRHSEPRGEKVGKAGSPTSEESSDDDEDEEIPARRVVPAREGMKGLGFARRGRGRGRGVCRGG
ncbi:hypothetical protein VC83_03671 [Pseudogymnoascus destructans]|uniref:JmjC domain-containing protein n=2 Tax=Pseudogymnoascus destructans TaxID=655981 RepID=L8G3D3_PSED2|nr:uncharacterized protein VC83_03671 [Pseudogymnoascus destructans]ELR07617.1 hypothetical protein GMDG_02665 [Pseudogymnoascus destructans 20631-21]OAF59823.1 hypothetical protein VC83_03671 [Pseudogymnoascus destructans]